MILNIDQQKLAQEIEHHIESIAFDGWSGSGSCLGSFRVNGKKIQVHLSATRDEDEFMDTNKKIVKLAKSKMVERG